MIELCFYGGGEMKIKELRDWNQIPRVGDFLADEHDIFSGRVSDVVWVDNGFGNPPRIRVLVGHGA